MYCQDCPVAEKTFITDEEWGTWEEVYTCPYDNYFHDECVKCPYENIEEDDAQQYGHIVERRMMRGELL